MYHVYVIVSDSSAERYYIGFSSRPYERLEEHNSGKNPSTVAHVPWRFTAIFITDDVAERVQPQMIDYICRLDLFWAKCIRFLLAERPFA
jgi:hypothetical protein